MNLQFNVAARIARPVEEVFEAIVDPAQLSRYFTTGGAKGRLEAGATVTWDFHDYPGASPVRVIELVTNRKIVLRWASDDKEGETAYETEVTMTFEALEDGRTLIAINEKGWRETPAGLDASYGNCQGWTQMLCALKAWLEYGINLRDGMFR